MAEATATGGVVLPAIRFTNLRHAALASLYLGLSFTWLPYPLVVLPHIVHDYHPTDTTTWIGYAVGIGAFFSIVVPPLVGLWSDRITSRFGRRRPLKYPAADLIFKEVDRGHREKKDVVQIRGNCRCHFVGSTYPGESN